MIRQKAGLALLAIASLFGGMLSEMSLAEANSSQFKPTRHNQANVMWVGHSLIGHDVPALTFAIAGSLGKANDYQSQIKNGSPLKCNTQRSCGQHEGVWALDALRTGKYDTVVLTEAVPLDNHIEWSEPGKYGAKFYDIAVRANSRTRVYVYETWHCLGTGTSAGCNYDNFDDLVWRPRLERDHAKWQKIVADINAHRTVYGHPVQLIPAGLAMGMLHDAIEAGEVPGISHISDLFLDDIHLNGLGAYFVAAVHYAAIYGESPVGAASTGLRSKVKWQRFQEPTAAQARIFQKIASKAVLGK